MAPVRIPRNLLKNGSLQHSQPKIITFDAYNTLYSIKKPVMEQYCIVGAKYGINGNPQELTKRFPGVFSNIRKKYPLYGKNSGITAEQWWENLIRDMFEPIQIPNEMVEEILERFEGDAAYTVYPDVREFLETMRRNHPEVSLGIVSNTDPIVLTLLENLDLKKYFDGNIYLSYDLEIKKPDPAMFNYAISDMLKRHNTGGQRENLENIRPHVWHVGDEEKADLGGAFQAGVNGILVDRSNSFGYFNITTPDVCKKELSEDDLSLRKVLHHSEVILQESDAVTDVVQLNSRQYVLPNFKSLEALLFQQ